MSTRTATRPQRARGRAEDTRARLVGAAADAFNRAGYHGTDSNRIARAAGYAPAMFYRHFADKRAIFLAAYERWVSTEWAAIEREIAAGGSVDEVTARIVGLVLDLHRRWRGLRASLLTLVVADARVRRFYREQRRRQLRMLADLRRRLRSARRSAAEDAVLLFELERTCDAVANGELADLGLAVRPVLAVLQRRIVAHLGR
jgi:AcrR family transcriptional regulator